MVKSNSSGQEGSQLNVPEELAVPKEPPTGQMDGKSLNKAQPGVNTLEALVKQEGRPLNQMNVPPQNIQQQISNQMKIVLN